VLEPGARIPSIQAWKDFYPVLTLFAFLSETELWIELGSLSLSLYFYANIVCIESSVLISLTTIPAILLLFYQNRQRGRKVTSSAVAVPSSKVLLLLIMLVVRFGWIVV
jgi:hypothetical protein